MPLKIETGAYERKSQGRTARELEFDNGAQSFTLTIWNDGVLEAEVHDYKAREWEDEEAFSVSDDDTPDVVMAITEFLGSL